MTSTHPPTDIDSIDWTEMRTAYMVGELHTLSRAAEHLGVHRSTIMRQITSLETHLGRKVFERKRDGYEPTSFGRELIATTRQVARDFQEFYLTGRSTQTNAGGKVNIAAPSYLTCLVTKAIAILQEQYPDIRCSFFAIDEDGFEIANGADITFNLLDRRTHGYSAQKLATLEIGLFASSTYVEKYGLPKTLEDLRDHKFVSDYPNCRDSGAAAWLRTHVPSRNIVFCSTSQYALHSAIVRGCGIGFLPTLIGSGDINLVQALEPSPKWAIPIWASIRRQRDHERRVQVLLDKFRQVL